MQIWKPFKSCGFSISHFELISIVTMSILLTVATVAAEENASGLGTKISSRQHLELGLDPSLKTAVLQIDIENQEFDAGVQLRQEIQSVVKEKATLNATTVLVSSDDHIVFDSLIHVDNFSRKNLFLIPIDSETSPISPDKKSRFLDLVKSFSVKRLATVKNDKFGLLVVTFTTVSESLVWIHSGHLSNFEKTSNVIFTIGLGIVFGLNKDTWSRTTRPFRSFFRNVLKAETNNPTDLKEVTSRFLGNFTLASLLTTARVPLISMDQILTQGVQLHLFTMPLLSAFIYTAAVFTWNEQIAMVDEAMHPVSKFVLRRMNESRSLFLGIFASTAALLNPGQHGLIPWVAVSAVGITGGFLYYKSEAVLKWIESQVLLDPLRSYLQKNKQASLFRCENLFAVTGS